MIDFQEFASRLSTLGPKRLTSDDIVDLATAADIRVSPDLQVDAALAQRLLDRALPAAPVTGAQIVASEWPPPTSTRPAAPPVTFSSPGVAQGRGDQPDRPRRSGPPRTGRRPDSRRNDR